MPFSTAEPVAAAALGTLDPTARLLFALAALLLLCRAAGAAARRIGQPPVLAELVVAALLGPGLLGALLPGAHQALFGPGTRPVLDGFGQLGLILLALRTGRTLGVRPPHEGPRESRAIAVVGAASFLLPLAVGGLCGLLLAPQPPHGTSPFGNARGITEIVVLTVGHDAGLPGSPARCARSWPGPATSECRDRDSTARRP
ncbi:hypothetical protein [Streptomyces sp. NPDC001415]